MLITTNEIIEADAKVCQCRRSPDEILYGATDFLSRTSEMSTRSDKSLRGEPDWM